MEKDEQLQRFFELCENSSFPHQEELLQGIRVGKYLLENHPESEVSSNELLDIYKRREKLLSKFKAEHAKRLKREVSLFVNELEKTTLEKVKIWIFSRDKSSSYDVFKGINSKKILSCLLTADKRKVSKSEWRRLWDE